jgi:hypothetical protein
VIDDYLLMLSPNAARTTGRDRNTAASQKSSAEQGKINRVAAKPRRSRKNHEGKPSNFALLRVLRVFAAALLIYAETKQRGQGIALPALSKIASLTVEP